MKDVLIIGFNCVVAVLTGLLGGSAPIPGFPKLPAVVPKSALKSCMFVFFVVSIFSWVYAATAHSWSPSGPPSYWVFFELSAVAGIISIFIGVVGVTRGHARLGYAGWIIAITFFLAAFNPQLIGMTSMFNGNLVLEGSDGFTMFMGSAAVVSNLSLWVCYRLDFGGFVPVRPRP